MKFKETRCSCQQCQGACATRPCWPTPDEAKSLRERFPERMVRDTSVYANGRPIEVWRPLAEGETAGGSYFNHHGRCTFLTTEGKCELHYQGKPMEGRLQSHALTPPQCAELRAKVARLWL